MCAALRLLKIFVFVAIKDERRSEKKHVGVAEKAG